MARPKDEHPTTGELEVLKVLWQRGPSTVRDVLAVLNEARPRAYTSVMSLMNVMAEKGQLVRREQGRRRQLPPDPLLGRAGRCGEGGPLASGLRPGIL